MTETNTRTTSDTLYNQPEKNLSRRIILKHAVECLTTERQTSCCVPNSHVQDLKNFFITGDNKRHKEEAFKLSEETIKKWEYFQTSKIGTKQPKDLLVCYLAGDDPSSDYYVLCELGIRSNNIWAFESDKTIHDTAVKNLANKNIFDLKLVDMSIDSFFELIPIQFDIIYLDFMKSIASKQETNIKTISTLFRYQRHSSLFALITNFSEPDAFDIQNKYMPFISSYFTAKRSFDSTDLSSSTDSAEKAEKNIENMNRNIKQDFSCHYGQFIPHLLIDMASNIIPWIRLIESTKHEHFYRDKYVQGLMKDFKRFDEALSANDQLDGLLANLHGSVSKFYLLLKLLMKKNKIEHQFTNKFLSSLFGNKTIDSSKLPRILQQLFLFQVYMLYPVKDDFDTVLSNDYGEVLLKIRERMIGKFSEQYVRSDLQTTFCEIFEALESYTELETFSEDYNVEHINRLTCEGYFDHSHKLSRGEFLITPQRKSYEDWVTIETVEEQVPWNYLDIILAANKLLKSEYLKNFQVHSVRTDWYRDDSVLWQQREQTNNQNIAVLPVKKQTYEDEQGDFLSDIRVKYRWLPGSSHYRNCSRRCLRGIKARRNRNIKLYPSTRQLKYIRLLERLPSSIDCLHNYLSEKLQKCQDSSDFSFITDVMINECKHKRLKHFRPRLKTMKKHCDALRKLKDGDWAALLQYYKRYKNLNPSSHFYEFHDVFQYDVVFLELLLSQLLSPVYPVISKHKSLTYKAQGKTHQMYLDCIIFDSCRYIFDYLPLGQLFPFIISRSSEELCLRFALDGLRKCLSNVSQDSFRGTLCSPITDGQTIQKRELIAPVEKIED